MVSQFVRTAVGLIVGGWLGATPLAAVESAKALDRGLAVDALGKVVARCTADDPYDRSVLAANGWTLDTSYSLRAPGQRSAAFKHAQLPGSLTLRSSYAVYVACSASIDIADQADFPGVRSDLINALGARAVSEPRLSENHTEFIKANELASLSEYAEAGQHLFLFELRQFSGRNLMVVYTFKQEGKAPK